MVGMKGTEYSDVVAYGQLSLFCARQSHGSKGFVTQDSCQYPVSKCFPQSYQSNVHILILEQGKDSSRVRGKTSWGGKMRSSVLKLSDKQWERVQNLARDIIFFVVMKNEIE